MQESSHSDGKFSKVTTGLGPSNDTGDKGEVPDVSTTSKGEEKGKGRGNGGSKTPPRKDSNNGMKFLDC